MSVIIRILFSTPRYEWMHASGAVSMCAMSPSWGILMSMVWNLIPVCQKFSAGVRVHCGIEFSLVFCRSLCFSLHIQEVLGLREGTEFKCKPVKKGDGVINASNATWTQIPGACCLMRLRQIMWPEWISNMCFRTHSYWDEQLNLSWQLGKFYFFLTVNCTGSSGNNMRYMFSTIKGSTHWSASTLKPLTGEVINSDYLVTVAPVAGQQVNSQF